MDYANDKEKIEGGIDYGENNIHESGRLQYTKSSNGEGETSRWQIRNNEATLSKNTEESRIYDIIDEQGISRTPITGTRTSDENDKTNSGENGNTRGNERKIEDSRPNEMDRTNEQLQDDSRGTDNGRIDLQLGEWNDVFEIPTENEQKQNIADVENTPAFFVSQEIIDNDLQRGSGFENGKFRIYQQFLKGETNIKNADFLKNEYGIGGHTVEIGGLFQNHDSKGLTFEESKTNKKYLLKWTQVAKRISELISADRYLSEQEKDEYNDWLDANGIFHNPKEDIINDEDYKLAERLHSFIKDYDYYSYLDNYPTENTEQDNIDLIRADIDDEMNIKNYIDFLKTTIEESEQDDEMLPEAKELLEELEKRLPYYEFNNRDVVYIGIDEYEIRSINDNIVELADTKFPLFTKEMPRKEFDKKIKENPANDKLRTGKRLLDLEKEEKSKIYDKYPSVRELFEYELAKGYTIEEQNAIEEIFRLDGMLDSLELKEAFKLGLREFFVFAIEQDLIKINESENNENKKD